jgi:hypothetical protein
MSRKQDRIDRLNERADRTIARLANLGRQHQQHKANGETFQAEATAGLLSGWSRRVAQDVETVADIQAGPQGRETVKTWAQRNGIL